MDRPGIAAVMPLYNKRSYVLEALDSMLRQTRLPDEIVVVDDGSTDGSGELVAERYGNDPRVRLIRQENRGPGAARNAAIRATTSPLLAFLDADDKWLPNKLHEQGEFMEQRPTCMLSFSNSIGYNEKTGETYYKPFLGKVDKKQYIEKVLFPQYAYIACNSVMIRRSALDEVGLFDEDLWTSQDTDLWLRIMLRFGFEYLPERLVWVRRGYPQTTEALERRRKGNDCYFRKHRYTFGRDLRGQAIWRAGYSAVLRANAIWYFRQNMGRRALVQLGRAALLWPFFHPGWVAKAAAEFALGSENYAGAVRIVRKVTGRRGAPPEKGLPGAD